MFLKMFFKPFSNFLPQKFLYLDRLFFSEISFNLISDVFYGPFNHMKFLKQLYLSIGTYQLMLVFILVIFPLSYFQRLIYNNNYNFYDMDYKKIPMLFLNSSFCIHSFRV